MRLRWVLVLCLVCLAIGGVVTWALTSRVVRIHAVCSIKTVGVGVYADQDCTIPVTSIDWGVMEPGETKGITVFIRNEGNVPSTLNITTENWSPSEAQAYITFTNNYNGSVLKPMDKVQVLFSLAIKSSITGITQFSFDIVITISG